MPGWPRSRNDLFDDAGPGIGIVLRIPPVLSGRLSLCCEILSREDRLGAMLAKCEEYHAWGLPFYRVIDPDKRAAWKYHSGAEPVRAIASVLAGEFTVNLKELFAVIDTAQ